MLQQKFGMFCEGRIFAGWKLVDNAKKKEKSVKCLIIVMLQADLSSFSWLDGWQLHNSHFHIKSFKALPVFLTPFPGSRVITGLSA